MIEIVQVDRSQTDPVLKDSDSSSWSIIDQSSVKR